MPNQISFNTRQTSSMSFFYQCIKNVISLLAFILFYAGSSDTYGQGIEHELVSRIERAPDDSSRILAMGELAAFYFENYKEFKSEKKSQLKLQLGDTVSESPPGIFVKQADDIMTFDYICST